MKEKLIILSLILLTIVSCSKNKGNKHTSINDEIPVFANEEWYVSSKDGVNVRADVNKDSKTLMKIKYNESVEVISVDHNVKIKYSNTEGWVPLESLKKRLWQIDKQYNSDKSYYYELISTSKQCGCASDYIEGTNECYIKIKDSKSNKTITTFRLRDKLDACSIIGWYDNENLIGESACCDQVTFTKLNIISKNETMIWGLGGAPSMEGRCNEDKNVVYSDEYKFTITWFDKNDEYYFIEDTANKKLTVYNTDGDRKRDAFMLFESKCAINDQLKIIDELSLDGNIEYLFDPKGFFFKVGEKKYEFKNNKIQKIE